MSRRIIYIALLTVILVGCDAGKTRCDRYVDGFVNASETCDLHQMDRIALNLESTGGTKDCSVESMRRFLEAANQCGITSD